MEMIHTHKAFLQTSIPIIISRYRAVWHQQKIPACTDLTMAVKNLHTLQNINNNIMDMDETRIMSGSDIVIELIPTLQHDNFAPVIRTWNTHISQRLPISISTLQPDLENCFVAKNSLNDPTRYTHVGKTPQPQNSMRSPSSSSHASQSPTKAPFAYSATSQDQALPTNYAQLSKIIADAIAHHEQGRRNKSPYSSQDSSSGSSYTNNSRSRDRDKSRDRSRDRREDNRRSDSRPSRERDERGDNNGRGQKGRDSYTRRDSSQPRSPIDHQRGDRSPSSERKPTDASGQQNKYK
jgi:hypothetical protein